jgi:sulfate adenylyltransferase
VTPASSGAPEVIAAPVAACDVVNLLVEPGRANQLGDESRRWPSWTLDARQLCDLELLLCGGYSPLRGFMHRADYESVCRSMRLADGSLWPIPITLDVSPEFAAAVRPDDRVALRDSEGVMLAALAVREIWAANPAQEAQSLFGSTAAEDPGAALVLGKVGRVLLGGEVEGLQLPLHYDFRHLRLTPSDLRAEFSRIGWQRVIAFQAGGSFTRDEAASMLAAARRTDAGLLVHQLVGMSEPTDVDHYRRVRQHGAALSGARAEGHRLALLPLASRCAGGRELIWRALVSRNYGCTHLLLKPEHADRDEALLREHIQEVGIQVLRYRSGLNAPRRQTPPGKAGGRLRQGVVVFFTGLSGAGKSTIANILLVKLLEKGGRSVTLLDGDRVRAHLSSELGFSKEHRDINIRRIGFVASEIARHGGIVVCAPIAPYDCVRKEVRRQVERVGRFLLVHVSTPLNVCERRDRKGLYAKAHAGLLQHFTGITDPYEAPLDADVVVDTTALSAEEAAISVVERLESEGYLARSRCPDF